MHTSILDQLFFSVCNFGEAWINYLECSDPWHVKNLFQVSAPLHSGPRCWENTRERSYRDTVRSLDIVMIMWDMNRQISTHENQAKTHIQATDAHRNNTSLINQRCSERMDNKSTKREMQNDLHAIVKEPILQSVLSLMCAYFGVINDDRIHTISAYSS